MIFNYTLLSGGGASVSALFPSDDFGECKALMISPDM